MALGLEPIAPPATTVDAWEAEAAELVELELRPGNVGATPLTRLPLELLRACGQCHALGTSGSSSERQGAMEDFLGNL